MDRRTRSVSWLCLVSVFVAGLGTVAFGRLFDMQAQRGAEGEIRAFLTSWNDAITRRDEAAIRVAYSANAAFSWFEDGERRYRTRDAIVAALGAVHAGASIDTELSDIRVRLLDADSAYVSASFTTRLGFEPEPIEYGGVFTSLVERSDGSWVFAAGHTSSVRAESRSQTPDAR